MLFSQCRSNADEHTLTQISKLTINVETGLSHRRWINVILLMLVQHCFVNVKTTSINISRLNFDFQPNFNVETTLVLNRRNSINVVSTLFCQIWNNVDKCTSAQFSFSTKYQRWCICSESLFRSQGI